MNIVYQDIVEILQSPVGRFNPKRSVCGKCDYYGSVAHAGLACYRCGGKMVEIGQWTVFNLLQRVKVHFRSNLNHSQEITWMVNAFVPKFLDEKFNQPNESFPFSLNHTELIGEFYLKFLKENS